MSSFGPKAHLASLIDNWGPFYVERVKAALDGTWKSQQAWEGLKEGVIEVGAAAEHARRRQGFGRGHVEEDRLRRDRAFKGPITKQDGTVGVEAGKVIDDGTLLGLNWYVKGVDDAIPQSRLVNLARLAGALLTMKRARFA